MEVEVLRPFELMIIRNFKTFSPEGGGQATPRKGVWIRSHLMAVREDYAYSMWKRWLYFVEQAWERGARIKPGNYISCLLYTPSKPTCGYLPAIN